MTDLAPSAEARLARLIDRLVTAAEVALAAGDLDSARATAEEVQAVDPDNDRAVALLRSIETRQRGASGERALMTLLFSDVVSSTSLSEKLEPEQLRDLFAFYRAAARDAVERYGGYVMKYMGDGILAGFGYPQPHEDDGRRAVLAGLDLVAAMNEAGPELEARLGEAPQVRIGIHTGRVVVTDLSDARSSDERDSIVGVAPNLAARIQQAAEPDMVVISDVTEHLVDTDFFLRSLGERHLKGISRPVEVFAVDRPRLAGARFYAKRYRQGALVGRDEPRDRLTSIWESVRGSSAAGSGRAAVVAGDPGIGKTRLVAELVHRVEGTGGLVLGTGCLPYYSNVSLWPIARLIERSLGVTADDADRLGALETSLSSLGLDPEHSLPFLGHLIGAEDPQRFPPPELDPAAFLDETLNRLVEWLAALATDTPRLLVVEDLHWADPSTLGLLARLVERRLPGVLTVATTRDAGTLAWVGATELVELSRLDPQATIGLVEAYTSGQALDESDRHRIVEQADGVPLFAEELARSFVSIEHTERIPMRLQELLAWRLKTPGVDLRTAQVAATVGPVFDAGTVSAVLDDSEAVESRLRALVDAGIVELDDPDLATYRFRHALMRDAAYETQVLDARRATHAAVAAELTAQAAEPALVAEHLDLAGQPALAVAQYIAGAQAEQAAGAHSEAKTLLDRAIDLLDDLPGSDERDLGELTARMLRAFSLSSMQGYAAPDVQLDHRRAEALTARLGSRPEVLPSLIAIWAYWFTSGDLGTSGALVERLSGMVEKEEFAWFLPEVESCAGFQHLYEGQLSFAQAHLERSMQGFQARPADQAVSPFWPLPNDPIAVSAIALSCLAALRGDDAELETWEARATKRAAEIGFPRGPFSLAFVKTYAAWSRRFRRDRETAQRLGAEIVEIGASYGYAYWMALGASYVGTAVPGEDADPDFLEQNLATLRLIGHRAFTASNVAFLAELVAERGDLDRAAALIEDAFDIMRKSGEYLHMPELLRLRAEYTLGRGGPTSEVVADLREAASVAESQGAIVSRLRAAVALARLPDDIRPADWRDVLTEVRSRVASVESPDTADADACLAE